MEHKRPPVPAIIIVLLAVLAGGYYGLQNLFAEKNGGLSASGTIEAVEVSVSPEMAGKVTEVLVEESDLVERDAPLIALDPSLLAAQRAVAQAGLDTAKSAASIAYAALESAQAQYDLAVIAARAEDQNTRLLDWATSTAAFEQPNWYFTREEQILSAQHELEIAEASLEEAQRALEETIADVKNANFVKAEERLANARIAYFVTLDVYTRSQMGGDGSEAWFINHIPPSASGYQYRKDLAEDADNGELIDVAKEDHDAAKDELDDAEQHYDDLLSTSAADDVLTARAELSVAKERYNAILDRLTMLHTGEFSPRVVAAQTAVDQAAAGVAQAEDAVAQAEANLALLDTQIEKLTVYAPVAGTVLTRNIEPGEFVQPGATLLILANLSDLKITVYVPEDRYGEISLGQNATLTVDSFPGETFSAAVTYISSAAEYTPRNVQTVEGRSSTVYAVKLKVDDPEGKLKPGMPADVVFE